MCHVFQKPVLQEQRPANPIAYVLPELLVMLIFSDSRHVTHAVFILLHQLRRARIALVLGPFDALVALQDSSFPSSVCASSEPEHHQREKSACDPSCESKQKYPEQHQISQSLHAPSPRHVMPKLGVSKLLDYPLHCTHPLDGLFGLAVVG